MQCWRHASTNAQTLEFPNSGWYLSDGRANACTHERCFMPRIISHFRASAARVVKCKGEVSSTVCFHKPGTPRNISNVRVRSVHLSVRGCLCLRVCGALMFGRIQSRPNPQGAMPKQAPLRSAPRRAGQVRLEGSIHMVGSKFEA
eukprot:1883222-Alexandrium_andersonii.AAC.1